MIERAEKEYVSRSILTSCSRQVCCFKSATRFIEKDKILWMNSTKFSVTVFSNIFVKVLRSPSGGTCRDIDEFRMLGCR